MFMQIVGETLTADRFYDPSEQKVAGIGIIPTGPWFGKRCAIGNSLRQGPVAPGLFIVFVEKFRVTNKIRNAAGMIQQFANGYLVFGLNRHIWQPFPEMIIQCQQTLVHKLQIAVAVMVLVTLAMRKFKWIAWAYPSSPGHGEQSYRYHWPGDNSRPDCLIRQPDPGHDTGDIKIVTGQMPKCALIV